MSDRTYDPVTGLLNRDGLIDQLESILAVGLAASMALVDLVRATPFGVHPAGADDATLRIVADLLARLSQPDAVACHLAGDEFVVLAEVDDDVALGQFLAQELESLHLHPHPGDPVVPVVSIGTAPVRAGMTPSQVLSLANNAVCDAKLALSA